MTKQATKNDPIAKEETPLLAQIDTKPETTGKNKTSSSIQHLLLPLAVAFLLGLVSGSLYGFGRYGRDLKDALHLSQSQIGRLGILLDCGSFIGRPITGYYFDRFGARISCFSAAAVLFLSFGLLHLGIQHHVLWVLGWNFFLVGFGSGLGYITALGSITKAFRSTDYLNLVIGLVASGYGLSTMLVGFTYTVAGLEYFFVLWAFIMAFSNMLGGFFLEVPTRIKTKTSPDIETQSSTGTRQAAAEQKEQPAWLTLDYWLLFFAFACTSGCGLFVINNVSTMAQSIGESDALAAKLITVLALSNVVGRLFIGWLADKVDRVVLFGAASVTMAIPLLLSALGQTTSYAYVALIGTVVLVTAAFGGVWVLVVGLLSTWFGSKNFGKNYGLITCGPAAGSIFFNSFSAMMYEKNIDKSDTSDVQGICVGLECYRGSYYLTGGAAVVSLLLILWLGHRRRSSSNP